MIGGVAAAAAVRTFPFRVFSFPSEIIIPGNQFLTVSMITRESLRILENNLQFTKALARDYDEDFASIPKIGTILNIRKPMRYMNA